MQTLKDSIRQLKKGTSCVSKFSIRFQSLCDQLSAIGHPLDESDKNHWFLCGMGSSFETFSSFPPHNGFLNQSPRFLIFFPKQKGMNFFLLPFTTQLHHRMPSFPLKNIPPLDLLHEEAFLIEGVVMANDQHITNYVKPTVIIQVIVLIWLPLPAKITAPIRI